MGVRATITFVRYYLAVPEKSGYIKSSLRNNEKSTHCSPLNKLKRLEENGINFVLKINHPIKTFLDSITRDLEVIGRVKSM